MSSEHDNEFELTCSAITNIRYIPNSAVVSEGQPHDDAPDIENKGDGKWKINFKSGRHKTKSVADSFKSAVGNTKYAMIVASIIGDDTPEELNFFFGLNLSIKLPNGGALDTVPIYLGQGSYGVENNWWLGARALVNAHDAYLLATQSGQVAWRAQVDMSKNSMSLSPKWPDKPHSFELLDVWGEGRIVTENGMVTGFNNSLNLNKNTQTISNGPQERQPIPQQVMVFSYEHPQFPVGDGAVQFVTLMGSPMNDVTAREIVRVLNPKSGAVILYDPNDAEVRVFEDNIKGTQLKYKPNDTLESPFDEIKMRNNYHRIYGFPESPEHIHDHDEL